MIADDRPLVGISACLLGEAVRYDGGHKKDAPLLDALGAHVRWVPVCPEVEAGFGIPRDPMHLVARTAVPGQPRSGPSGENAQRRTGGGSASVALVVVRTGQDVTPRIDVLAERRIEELSRLRLSGYVFKSRSPSCGLAEVPLHDTRGAIVGTSRGIFAARLLDRFPGMPMAEETWLWDARRRERFLACVMAYRSVTAFFDRPWTPADLVSFHRSGAGWWGLPVDDVGRMLERIVAEADTRPPAETAARYTGSFLRALTAGQ